MLVRSGGWLANRTLIKLDLPIRDREQGTRAWLGLLYPEPANEIIWDLQLNLSPSETGTALLLSMVVHLRADEAHRHAAEFHSFLVMTLYGLQAVLNLVAIASGLHAILVAGKRLKRLK